MGIQKTEAIVLRSYKLGEADKIAIFLTKDFGKLRGVAKKSRQAFSRFGSCLEPLSHIWLIFYEKEGQELVQINQCDLIKSYFQIQQDIITGAYMAYIAELIIEFMPERDVNEPIYRLLLMLLSAITEGIDIRLIVRYCEFWILKIQGYLPSWEEKCQKCSKGLFINSQPAFLQPNGLLCPTCNAQSSTSNLLIHKMSFQIIQFILKNKIDKMKILRITDDALKEIAGLSHFLITYYLEKELKSHLYLKSINSYNQIMKE
jgi:DNA repair protein RecO (recombination protein O)